VLEDAEDAVGMAFEDEGDIVFLLGAPTVPGLAGSELQRFLDLSLGGRLAPVDLELEGALAELLHVAAREQLVQSAHDVSGGGLVVALAEACVAGAIGVEVSLPGELSASQELWSEAPGRVLVTVASQHVRDFAQLCADAEVALADIGTVGGNGLVVRDLLDLSLDELEEAFDGGLPAALGA
jgi:phosphoribosylformylglycinamidine synthase subunit PurL